MQSKGKVSTTDDGVPAKKLSSIDDILNQTRFFKKPDHLFEYGKGFYTRIVLTPKIMNFLLFAQSRLYFHHHLHFQGLEQFLTLKAPYFKRI